MTGIGGWQWFVALLAAVLLHAAIAAAVLWEAPLAGAASAGVGGIEVSLGPTGGAPGSPPTTATGGEEVEASEATEAKDAPQPEAMTVHKQPVETAAPREVAEVEPAEPAEAVAETLPVATEAAEPEFTAEPVEAESQEVEAQETQEVEAAAEEQVAEVEAGKPAPPMPEVRPRDLPEPERRIEPEQNPPLDSEPEEFAAPVGEADPQAEQTAKAAPSTAGTEGRAGTAGGTETGSASSATGGGNPGQVADYMAQLQAWLERHKEYPRRAKLRRQEGTVLLYFVMNREGRVLEYRIRQRSGHASLDRAVEEMIERAQPLPKMPQEMRQARLELVVPVQFFLR